MQPNECDYEHETNSTGF